MSQSKVTYIDHCGNDLTTVNSARVSFDKKSAWKENPVWGISNETGEPYWISSGVLQDKDTRLIRFLARHGHTSPFNHTFITLHVKAPVFVARQMVKHKFMPWNEVSGRYVVFKPEFYMPDEFRAKAPDKKQGSGDPIVDDEGLRWLFEGAHADAFNNYTCALDLGLCEEQARALLPLDLMTQWYWSGTLGAWASMYNLRAKPDAQAETRMIAEQAGSLIEPLFPVSWGALTGNDEKNNESE